MKKFQVAISLLSTCMAFACSTKDDEKSDLSAQAAKGEGRISISTSTRFKISKADTSTLAATPNNHCLIPKGTILAVKSFDGVASDDGHVRATLASAPLGCNFVTGYFYRSHVQIARNADPFSNRAEADATSAAGANKILINYYGKEPNYNQVYRNVVNGWFGTTTMGCVAFVSSAMRLSKVADIPFDETSTVTLPFSRHLQFKLGWIKITNYNNVQPGDVVFTKDDPNWPGYPAHTYVFAGWHNRSTAHGYAIDNQDYRYIRNLGAGGKTPFAYALRAPN